MQVVATGAGAGLVIEFLAFAAAAEKVPVRAVTVCYSCDSPPLLRFVTSELLARRVSGIRIVTALFEPGSSGGVDKVLYAEASRGGRPWVEAIGFGSAGGFVAELSRKVKLRKMSMDRCGNSQIA